MKVFLAGFLATALCLSTMAFAWPWDFLFYGSSMASYTDAGATRYSWECNSASFPKTCSYYFWGKCGNEMMGGMTMNMRGTGLNGQDYSAYTFTATLLGNPITMSYNYGGLEQTEIHINSGWATISGACGNNFNNEIAYYGTIKIEPPETVTTTTLNPTTTSIPSSATTTTYLQGTTTTTTAEPYINIGGNTCTPFFGDMGCGDDAGIFKKLWLTIIGFLQSVGLLK